MKSLGRSGPPPCPASAMLGQVSAMGGGCVARRPSLSGNSDGLQGVGVKSSEPDGPETLPPQNHAKQRLKQKVLTKIPRSGHTRILCNSSLTETVRYTDRKSTRLNSSHSQISYAVFCL